MQTEIHPDRIARCDRDSCVDPLSCFRAGAGKGTAHHLPEHYEADRAGRDAFEDYEGRLPLAATGDFLGFLNLHDLLDSYVKNKRIWACPSANAPLQDIYGKTVCYYGWNATYLNTAAGGGQLDPANLFDLNNASGVALAAADKPAHTVLMTDNRGIESKLPHNHLITYTLPPSYTANVDYWGRPEPGHSVGVVVTLLNGHAKWFRLGGFYEGQLPADDWFALNQP